MPELSTLINEEPARNAGATSDMPLMSGQEDPLEEEMATHSSIFVWRIPMDRGAWWATVHGVEKSQTGLK